MPERNWLFRLFGLWVAPMLVVDSLNRSRVLDCWDKWCDNEAVVMTLSHPNWALHLPLSEQMGTSGASASLQPQAVSPIKKSYIRHTGFLHLLPQNQAQIPLPMAWGSSKTSHMSEKSTRPCWLPTSPPKVTKTTPHHILTWTWGAGWCPDTERHPSPWWPAGYTGPRTLPCWGQGESRWGLRGLDSITRLPHLSPWESLACGKWGPRLSLLWWCPWWCSTACGVPGGPCLWWAHPAGRQRAEGQAGSQPPPVPAPSLAAPSSLWSTLLSGRQCTKSLPSGQEPGKGAKAMEGRGWIRSVKKHQHASRSVAHEWVKIH